MNTLTPSHPPTPSDPGVGLAARVLDIFAEVTRYPAEILDPEASLEEDLGIDSVKLGEVFSVLRERFQLPEKLDLPREELKTIAGVTGALGRFLARGATAPSAHGNGLPAPVDPALSREVGVSGAASAGRNGEPADLDRQVLAVFAEVTRYPAEILDPTASLEEELGVDSVKLGEVFSVLRERFELPEKLDLPREGLKTIGGVTEALRQYLSKGSNGNGSGALEPARTILPTPRPATAPPASIETAAKAGANGSLRANGSDSSGNVEDEVVRALAQATQHPRELLKPAARLEEDLGVGAGALQEILAALCQRFGVSLEWNLARQRGSTISNLVDALSRQLSQASGLAGGVAGRPNGKGGSDKVEIGPARSAASFAALQPALKPFAGKIAFVSGSGRGLGKEIAVYLAELGATVVINSFHSRPKGEETVREIQAAGGEAIHLWGSMANPTHMDQLFDGIEQRYGGIDFFISSASNGMLARLKDITAEDWEKAFRTNVVGLHQGAMRSAQLMRKRGGGKIITMSSPAAHGYVDYFGCMGAVKAAVESLTRSLAIELAADNIQVNCISPGPVYGDLLNKWPESERLVKQWERNTAYGRLCKADEVAHFVAYMLSDSVKLFTGSVLVMDGGISAQGW